MSGTRFGDVCGHGVVPGRGVVRGASVTDLELMTRQLAAYNDWVEIAKRARQLAAERSAEEIRLLLRDWRRRQRSRG